MGEYVCQDQRSDEVAALKCYDLAVDGRCLEEGMTGTGVYISRLINYFVRKGLNVIVVSQKVIPEQNLPYGVSVAVETNPLARKMKGNLWYSFFSYRLYRKINFKYFVASSTIVPLLEGRRKLVIVHDLNLYMCPASMSFLLLIIHWLFFKRSLFIADVLLANSRSTAIKVAVKFGLKINHIVSPFDPSRLKPPSVSDCKVVLSGYELEPGFILAVSTMEPRKRFTYILDEYRSYCDSLSEDKPAKLVLVGPDGWGTTELRRRMQTQYNVSHLGYVSNEELAVLYASCGLFVFPSYYEGYGIPVREAASLGAKVVASDIPELREAGEGYDCSFLEMRQGDLCRYLSMNL